MLRNTTTHHSLSFVSTTFSILTILLIGSNHWQSYGCRFSISIFSQSYIIVHLFREVLPKKQRIKPNGLKCSCHDPIFGIISFISHLYDMAFPPVVRSCSNISNSLLCRVIFLAYSVHASRLHMHLKKCSFFVRLRPMFSAENGIVSSPPQKTLGSETLMQPSSLWQFQSESLARYHTKNLNTNNLFENCWIAV